MTAWCKHEGDVWATLRHCAMQRAPGEFRLVNRVQLACVRLFGMSLKPLYIVREVELKSLLVVF